MGSLSSAWKTAVNRAVKPATFNSPAPPINSPVGLVDSPEVGNDTGGYVRKKRGKASLKISPNSNVTRGVGLNI